MKSRLYLLLLFWFIPASIHAESVDLEEQVRRIATELRCPVCQNLSVADSPSEMAQQMRAIIQRQLKEGKSPDEVKTYFISKYGEWVMLAPRAKGFSLLIWILPFVALGGGILFVVVMVRRWAKNRPERPSTAADPAMAQRIRRDMSRRKNWEVPPHLEGPQVHLLRERARLYNEIQELELDYHAGKLSEADYHEARQGYEEQASGVLRELGSQVPSESQNPVKKDEPKSSQSGSRPGWVFTVTAAFLLLFGVTLGVLLSHSLRTRTSPQDSITGDFLTGTTAQRGDLDALLKQGRDAYSRQEWAQSIDAFKKVLAIEARHPEAHSYMGLILAGAGHGDAAILAFNRALSIDPDYALALWGNGMVLYRQKGNLPGAREKLKKLLTLLPPGAERQNVLQTIAEINQRKGTRLASQAAPVTDGIQGTISIEPKLKTKHQEGGTLFIIARRAATQGGPPLAVKRIASPVFPLSYSLGKENTMIPGSVFEGRVNIIVRLDQDGDPLTRGPDDLTGSYEKNPVAIGSQNVDIVLSAGVQ